jgi:hypothetical protein
MSMTLDRKTLQEIRDSAHLLAKETDDDFALEYWCALAAAADRLDAMLARKDAEENKPYFTANICPKCGLDSLRHEFTAEELKDQCRPLEATFLSPCPACGSTTSETVQWMGLDSAGAVISRWSVRCCRCRARTDDFATAALAQKSWHKSA